MGKRLEMTHSDQKTHDDSKPSADQRTPAEKAHRNTSSPVISNGDPDSINERHSDIFFAAVETTRMPMIVTDPRQSDNPIIFANNAFLTMTGYDAAEIVGSNCRFLQGADTDPETVAQVRNAIAKEQEIAVEIINYRKDRSTFWNALFISPVYNRRGDLVYFFGSQLDISRRRDAEDALRQSQKMEALGQLTGGIAHDFNNLLQVVGGYTDNLQHDLKGSLNPRSQRALDNIGMAVERATTLTQQLLAFARKQTLKGRPVNLNSLVDSMSELARRTLGENIDFQVRASEDLANCRIDPTQAELALLNVLINARDAMPNGGKVVIETENRLIGQEDTLAFEGVRPGQYSAIAVTDTGQGMSADILARVMEPFFTTKEPGKGTGLGLAMVYGFAKQSGGAVRIYSEPNHGTTVRLFFPSIEQEETAGPRIISERAVERYGHEAVLVVEDREDVAELARSILDDFGYRVTVTRNAAEALRVLDREMRFDMLFSDLIMPGGMNGVMLAREARRRQPKLKILLTTGYAEASMERTDIAGTEFEVINKPYRRRELARRVRQILDGPTGTG